MDNRNKSSEGEELIGEYLGAEGIDFKSEEKIENLKNDNIPYRKADFYLPQYKAYVEFLGLWNVEKNREQYKEKQRVYAENNIPCIYLYPDNLGILNFIFKRRLKNELKKHDMKWELLKLNWNIFQEKYALAVFVFILMLFFVDNLIAKIILGLLFIWHLITGIKSTFFK